MLRSALESPVETINPDLAPIPLRPPILPRFSVTELEVFSKSPIEYKTGYVLNLPEHFRSPTGRKKVNLGMLTGNTVHEIMERTGLADTEGIELNINHNAGTAHLSDEETAELKLTVNHALSTLRNCKKLDVILAGNHHRELPFCLPLKSGAIDGVFDVVFKESSHWIVLDYKTDRKKPGETPRDWIAERKSAHEFQMKTYALAVKELISPDQDDYYVMILLTDTGDEIEYCFSSTELMEFKSGLNQLILEILKLRF